MLFGGGGAWELLGASEVLAGGGGVSDFLGASVVLTGGGGGAWLLTEVGAGAGVEVETGVEVVRPLLVSGQI